MATKVDNETGGQLAAALQPFTTHTGSFRGNKVDPLFDPEGCDYLVWSYRTIVAKHHPKDGWWITDTKYSPTTSRHLSTLKFHITRAVA